MNDLNDVEITAWEKKKHTFLFMTAVNAKEY